MTRSSAAEPVLDHAQAVASLPERHVFLRDRVVGADHIDELAHLLGADRDIRHQQRLIRRRARHPDAREHARREQALRDWRTPARPRIVPVERSITLSTKSIRPVWTKSCSSISLSARPAAVAAARSTSVLAAARAARSADSDASSKVNSKRIGSVETMVASNVVLPAGAAGDEIAGRHAPVADAAADRRAQFGEFQIELGLPHRASLAATCGLGVALGLRALVEHLLGDGLVAHQLLARARGRPRRRRAWRLRRARDWRAPARARSGTAACRW